MATDHNFRIKNGLTVGTVEVIDSSGKLTANAFGTNSNEKIEDVVADMITGSTHSNITVTYNDTNGTLAFSAAAQYGDSDVESYLDSGVSTPSFATISSGAITSSGAIDGTKISVDSGTGNGLRLHTNSGITASNNYMNFFTSQTSGWSFNANGTGADSGSVFTISSTGNASFSGSITGSIAASNIDSGRLADARMPTTIGSSASTIFVGTLSGNASTASNTPVYATGSNATHYITFAATNGGGNSSGAGSQARLSDGHLTYNPSTNALGVSGNISAGTISTGAITATTVDTGQGANELYAMNQNVRTTDSPTFNQVTTTNNGSGTNYKVGDDAWIGDINVANTIRISGAQNANNGYISFGNSSNTALGRAGTGQLTWGSDEIYHEGHKPTYSELGTMAYSNLTGTPTIPSLSGYATESYVNTQVSNLVDSAPGSLDTLNELAAALGDDANFSTTVTNSIATKLPLAGGTITGAGTTALTVTNTSGNGGYFNVKSNVGGVGTDGQVGLHIGWNKSNGGREINMIFDGGTAQADTEMIFTSTDGSTYTDIFQINGATSGSSAGVDIKTGGLMIGGTRKDTNWDTAYGWGNHASAGYITDGNTNWNNTYGFITSSDSSITNKMPLAGGTFTGGTTYNVSGDAITISSGAPQIRFNDTTSAEDDFWIHINSNRFYVLTDRADDGTWETPHPLELNASNNIGYLFGQRIFNEAYHPNADTWTTARTISLGGDLTGNVSINGSQDVILTATVADDSHNHIISNVDGLQSALDGKTPLDHLRSLGTQAFTAGGGSNSSTTTSALIGEMEGDGAFDSYTSAFKTSWSYASNDNLSDAGRFTETAGTSFLTWTDNSSDSTRGNITVLAIAPNTGGSAGRMFVYNDQGSSYAPGWREVWTSTSDGANSGLDADLLDGQEGSYYLNYNNLTNTPSASANYYLNGISKSGNTLTFSVNGATNQTYTFGSNAFNSTTIPTNNNQLTNGAGYTTYTANQSLNTSNSPTFAGLDVDGIIDNTRNNGNVAAPSTSDHTAGTRIKFYDASATSFYAIGIESDTMWFNSDNRYKWYQDAAIRMTLDGANLTVTGTVTASSYNPPANSTASYNGYNGAPIVVGVNGAAYYHGSDNGGYGIVIQGGHPICKSVKIGSVNAGTTVIDSSRNLSNINAGAFGQDVSAMDTTNLDLEVVNNMSIRGSSALYFGITSNNYNSWKTRLYNNNTSTMQINAQALNFNNVGYGSSTFFLANSTGFDIKTGSLLINAQTVIDSSRNITAGQVKTNYTTYAPNPDTFTYLSANELQFGGNNNGYESNSAQISAGQHQANSMNFVGMGTSSGARRMDFWVEGNAYFRGSVIATGNVTAYGSASDKRLKKDIVKIDNAIDKIKSVTGYEFAWNENAPEDKQDKREFGVIAQEVEEAGLDKLVFEYERPVSGTDEDNKDLPDEKWKAVHYDKFVPILIEAVKEQQEQIEELKSIINTLVESK